MKKTIDLSIIITAHHEGILSHKTILSVLAGVSQLDKSNISYEIIVSMDNPDQATEEYYQRYQNDSRFNILKVSYGNVSDSRNNAIQQAKGKYVALLDGDDMVSKDWYIRAYRLAESKKTPSIIHPNYQIQFGPGKEFINIWKMGSSLGKEEDAIISVQYNRWPSPLLANKEIFDEVKYKRPVNGYGYEDFCFNTDTLDKGYVHYVAPKTCFYYRRLLSGKQNEHIVNYTLLPYTNFFDIESAKKWHVPDKINVKGNNKEDGSKKLSIRQTKLYKAIRTTKLATFIIEKNLGTVREALYKKKIKLLPSWLIEDWKEINKIDHQLWPTVDAVSTTRFHPRSFDQNGPDAKRVGYKYAKLCRQFTKKPDYIIFTYDPLGAGGTEKVMANYINALKQQHPNWHFAVMRKKPDNFPFGVPEDVDFVDFFGELEGMDLYEKKIVLDRLMVQLQVKRLHCFFNGFAEYDIMFKWVKHHKDFLVKNNYKVYISWFMNEWVPDSEKGRILSFADPYLRIIYPAVTKVMTDNGTIIDQVIETNAYDRDKFVVHHQPMNITELVKPRQINPDKPLRVLWASRLSYQKRPDILKEIAQKVDPNQIKIDVFGREQNYRGSFLSGIPALEYKGHFNGLSSLPLSDYDVFLYTSQVDGMPNVLLEAAAAGLPIVASNDGGVSEFIKDGKTGKLVELEDVDGYISALNYYKNNPAKASAFAKQAQKNLSTDYTSEAFFEAVKKDIN